MQVNAEIAERFYSKVGSLGIGCWEWLAGTSNTGYGRFKVAGKHEGASRVSYTLHNGPIPKGLEVCHRCDNPKCVRPSHLFVGTRSENMLDCSLKGRHKHNQKLLLESVGIDYVLPMAQKLGIKGAARKLKVTHRTVRKFLQRKGFDTRRIWCRKRVS